MDEDLRQIADPVERANRIRARMAEHNQANSALAGMLREAVAELLQTKSKSEAAVLLGVTKGRITQLSG
jgi:predicted house-cleaning noncanonical NTP pyrophosphatase (MazG superfamily)